MKKISASISELRSICQTTAKKDISNIYMRLFCRKISIYVTWFFLKMGVSADQASFLMIVVGTVASLCFLIPEALSFLGGALLLQLWYILDCVDGEIARYHHYQQSRVITQHKNEMPITGAYWDYLNHYIVHGLTPLTLSYGLFFLDYDFHWFLWGFAASLSQILLLAVHDTKSRAFMELVRRGQAGQSLCFKEAKTAVSSPAPTATKKIFMALHYSCTYPTVMNALTLCAILNFYGAWGGVLDWRAVFLVYYAVASCMVFLGLFSKNVRSQAIDREFAERYSFIAQKSSSG